MNTRLLEILHGTVLHLNILQEKCALRRRPKEDPVPRMIHHAREATSLHQTAERTFREALHPSQTLLVLGQKLHLELLMLVHDLHARASHLPEFSGRCTKARLWAHALWEEAQEPGATRIHLERHEDAWGIVMRTGPSHALLAGHCPHAPSHEVAAHAMSQALSLAPKGPQVHVFLDDIQVIEHARGESFTLRGDRRLPPGLDKALKESAAPHTQIEPRSRTSVPFGTDFSALDPRVGISIGLARKAKAASGEHPYHPPSIQEFLSSP